jgi:AcrR family transcriptional regulator
VSNKELKNHSEQNFTGPTRRSAGKEKTGKILLQAGREEFLLSGYQNTSMRDIARRAGLSVGAVYVHFKDKLSLFEAITEPVITDLLNMFTESREEFDGLAYDHRAEESIGLANQKVRQMINFIYDHIQIFKLLQDGPRGHTLEQLINRAADVHLVQMKDYNRLLTDLGVSFNEVSDEVLHILNTSYLTAVFEPVIHDLSRQEALAYIESILMFFNAGWEAIFQLKDNK